MLENKQYFDVSFLNLEQKERKIAHCLEIIFWIKLFWFMMMKLVNRKFKNLTFILMLGKVNPLLILVLHFEINLKSLIENVESRCNAAFYKVKMTYCLNY